MNELCYSESGGGYSDAATAPLRGSDTESSRGQGHVSTPSTSGLRSPGCLLFSYCICSSSIAYALLLLNMLLFYCICSSPIVYMYYAHDSETHFLLFISLFIHRL